MERHPDVPLVFWVDISHIEGVMCCGIHVQACTICKPNPDYVRTSCSRRHTGTGTGFGPLTWAHSDRFGARWTLPTAQSTRSIEQDALGT